jgi:hypothetical protein
MECGAVVPIPEVRIEEAFKVIRCRVTTCRTEHLLSATKSKTIWDLNTVEKAADESCVSSQREYLLKLSKEWNAKG